MKKVMMVAMVLGMSGLVASAAQTSMCSSCGKASNKCKVVSSNTAKMQTTCPVTGRKINNALYVDQGGQRIYVCCKGCIAPVQKNFAKYAKKIEAAGETVAKLQTTCPVMGGKINKKQYVDVDGKRIYACCPDCIKMIKANPEKYIKQLEAKGVTLDKSPKQSDRHTEHNQ